MTYSENIKFSKLNYFDFYLIAVISFLPISVIIGNLFLNINILLFIYPCDVKPNDNAKFIKLNDVNIGHGEGPTK